jgi:hypothetical protein
MKIFRHIVGNKKRSYDGHKVGNKRSYVIIEGAGICERYYFLFFRGYTTHSEGNILFKRIMSESERMSENLEGLEYG